MTPPPPGEPGGRARYRVATEESAASLVTGRHGSHRARRITLRARPLGPDDMGKLVWAAPAGGAGGGLGLRAEAAAAAAGGPAAQTTLGLGWVVGALRRPPPGGAAAGKATVPDDG